MNTTLPPNQEDKVCGTPTLQQSSPGPALHTSRNCSFSSVSLDHETLGARQTARPLRLFGRSVLASIDADRSDHHLIVLISFNISDRKLI